jgi:hypothetical protein
MFGEPTAFIHSLSRYFSSARVSRAILISSDNWRRRARPLIEDAEGQAAFDEDAFQRRILATAEPDGRA